MSTEIIEWLKDQSARAGITQAALAKKLGIEVTAMNKVFRGTRRLKAEELRKAERLFQSAPAKPPQRETDDVEPAAPIGDPISEIDVKGGAGFGGEAMLVNITSESGETISTDAVKGTWHFPPEYLSEMRVRAKRVRIIEIFGDSMRRPDGGGLHSGDRVMIDLADVNPTPPGIFALWDGFGIVVKRLERVMRSDPPAIHVISDNPSHPATILTYDEVNIVGRVIWFARRL